MKLKHLIFTLLTSTAFNCFGQKFGFKPYQEYVQQKTIATEVAKAVSLNPFNLPEWNSIISVNESGDGIVSIPLTTVNGRRLTLPITLKYVTNGIKVDQVSSEVGLGWNISFGSITRNYGAFEPDYTSTESEFEMKNFRTSPQVNLDGRLCSTEPQNLLNEINPLSYHKKQLQYTGVQSGKAPDNYQVTIPGYFSNDFWNMAATGSTNPNFIFSQNTPWKIDFDKKTFIFGQEISRVNEWTYKENATNTALLSCIGYGSNDGYNMAAAIGFLPYVRHYKANTLVNTSSGDGSNSPIETRPPHLFCNPSTYQGNESARIEYEDFSKFTLTASDGTKYIFGRALRGQKYLFTEEPFWSAYNVKADRFNQMCYGEFWKTDFIAEWLLTEILSNDYIDANSNGYADDGDKGDWIKIEYTPEIDVEFVAAIGIMPFKAVHREWNNFTQTDKESSLFRERAYVTKIITPVQEIEFSNSERFDVNHDYFKEIFNRKDNAYKYYDFMNVYMDPNWGLTCFGGDGGITPNPIPFDYKVYVKYPVETRKYDLLTIKDKSNNAVRTVKLNYAAQGSSQELAVSKYLMLKNDKTHVPTDPSYTIDINSYLQNTGRGKTTLLGIDYEGSQTGSGAKMSYSFSYNYNPSYNDIHKFHIHKQWAMPTIRESWDGSQRRFSGKYPSLGANKPVFNTMVPWKWLQADYSTTVTSGSSYVFGVDNSLNGAEFPNNLLTDELGYFYDATHATTYGRDAWSLSSITLPYGGEIKMEYELDDFDIVADRNAWKATGLADYAMPASGHYNNLAHLRSIKQDYVNSQEDPTTNQGSTKRKKLYREYYYLMNTNTGGLRLKNIKYFEPITYTTIQKNYKYGPGHYTAPPAEYWEKYMEGFNSFMQSETGRHYYEEIYAANAGQSGPNILCGNYPFNDFTIYMSRLVTNTRVDNSIALQAKHYYEYVDEVGPTGEKTRRFYGRLYQNNKTLSPIVYHAINDAVLKQEFLDRTDVVELLTTDVDFSKEIGNYKTEYYNKSNVLVKEEGGEYEFSQVAENTVTSKRMDFSKIEYPPVIPDWSNSPLTNTNPPKWLGYMANANTTFLYEGLNNSLLSAVGYNYGSSYDGHIDLVGVARNPLFLLEYTSSYRNNAPSWFQPLLSTTVPWNGTSGISASQISAGMGNLKNTADEFSTKISNYPFNTEAYNFYVEEKHKIKPLTFKTHQSYKLRPIYIYSINHF